MDFIRELQYIHMHPEECKPVIWTDVAIAGRKGNKKDKKLKIILDKASKKAYNNNNNNNNCQEVQMNKYRKINTHNELVLLHGEAVKFLYGKKKIKGIISVRTRKAGKSYIYLCNTTKGRNVNKLKIEDSFGFNKALMISYSVGDNRYEMKNQKTINIMAKEKEVMEDGWTILDGNNTPVDLENEMRYKIEYKNSATGWTPSICSNGAVATFAYRGTLDDKYRYKEIKKMNNKEKALKELEIIKERMVELEGIIKEPIGYDCLTPIDYKGDIIFNNKNQVLSVCTGVWEVTTTKDFDNLWWDNKNLFQWIPIKREDLKVGDTAYHTGRAQPGFINNENVVKILNGEDCVTVKRDSNVRVEDDVWVNWYKLVKKEM